ncbi:MAG: ATP-binding cassette domain-containing protein [candidate division Zixibacteria bacterium]|nr:ATP-binding cassette domain-containing protein [candidate division Zixibacteria bacterium]MDH3935879.1 ATP-binding cassette domain-containing protein [candidate division Zixibacteria bacterium]MDH4034285.1 ATP-binding cassette domain-containing protein [candidate division Zixibacteria bacterium]
MTLVTAERISQKFNDQVILKDVSFTIKTGDRIGLVGKNGCGKTTLFEIMAGRMELDQGKVHHSRRCGIDYIEQESTQYADLTLFEYVSSARDDLAAMRTEIGGLEHHLQIEPEDREQLNRLGELQERFELEGGFSFENDVNTIVHGLGFEKNRFSDLMKNFSGGERNRAGLAKALAGKGNLLLLDEPTNHLDIESTRWLEEYLKETERSFVVVSHDRSFLSATINKIWELRLAKLEFYTGGLENYLAERTARRSQHEHRYRHQQEEIKRLEDFVRRNMAGQKTKQAQSKLKYLGRIKRLAKPRGDGLQEKIGMASSGRSFAHVLSIPEVSLGYGDKAVIHNLSLDVYRGDKVGIIGRNGSGKSTLLKTLIGQLAPVRGEIRLGHQVDVAYFDQELSDLNSESTVLDSMWEMEPMAVVGKIRSYLARFGFSDEDPFKLVANLSGGEKTKLSLARLLYHPANFIIFDEPTNHLDMDSRERLEEALIAYDGSCLIVSHDRYFLNKVVDRILHLNDGVATMYDGNYAYFREKTEKGDQPATQKPEKSKDDYHAFKEKSRQRGRHKKLLQSTRDKIVQLEEELKRLAHELEHEIAPEDWERLTAATTRKTEIEAQLLEQLAQLEKLEEVELD